MPGPNTEPPYEWERLPEETDEAFRAFAAYRDLPGRRSVLRAYLTLNPQKRARRPPRWWQNWATRHEWEQRASAYLNHQDALQREEREKALREEAAEYEREKAQLRRKQLEVGKQIVVRAEELLRYPSVRSRAEDGVTILEPAGWTQSDIPRLAQAGFALIQQATEEFTDDLGRFVASQNPDEQAAQNPLTPDEIERFIHTVVLIDATHATLQQSPRPAPPSDLAEGTEGSSGESGSAA